VAFLQAGKEEGAMKLTVKTKRYSLGKSCGCSKNVQSTCGINYRSGV